jgi:bifunctional DNA-binding transcriptional regulator/antitoxin component of YhaV-PrlF toxin-antitoxin module
VLKVTVRAVHFFGSWVTFHYRMDRSGRITIPRLARDELINREEDRQHLIGSVLEVRLEPA